MRPYHGLSATASRRAGEKGQQSLARKVWEVMAAEGLANECLQAEQLLRMRLPKLRNPKLAGKATLTLGFDPH